MTMTYQTIKDAVIKKGHVFFSNHMNLNFIGIRNLNGKVNDWDDRFALLWEENGSQKAWISQSFTTDPGIYYLEKEMLSPKGCAILAPGQYKALWTFGKHRGKYDAFIQLNPCKVYRDRDKDNILDFDPASIDNGNFGINLHHGYDSANVGPHSAGCQVFKYEKHLSHVLDIAKKSATMYGNKFTYTLLTSADF
jgi:hypothetical protein